MDILLTLLLAKLAAIIFGGVYGYLLAKLILRLCPR